MNENEQEWTRMNENISIPIKYIGWNKLTLLDHVKEHMFAIDFLMRLKTKTQNVNGINIDPKKRVILIKEKNRRSGQTKSNCSGNAFMIELAEWIISLGSYLIKLLKVEHKERGSSREAITADGLP